MLVRVGTPSSPGTTTAEHGALAAAAALLTTAQVARRDGVTAKCVRERIKAGRLLGVKVGDRWLVEDRP